jgi:hypothetical protein
LGFFLRELDRRVQRRAPRKGELDAKSLEARQAACCGYQRLSQQPDCINRQEHPEEPGGGGPNDVRYLVATISDLSIEPTISANCRKDNARRGTVWSIRLTMGEFSR